MKRLLLLSLLLTPMLWAVDAQLYCSPVVIDYTKVPNTNQSNFPVLFSVTDARFKSVANGGHVNNGNGYDLIPYSDSTCATRLDFEREGYVATTGAVLFWVEIPTVSYTANTTYYWGYGDTGISTDQQTATGVWDANFKGVWHLGDGTTLSVADSTSGANNGTNSGGAATSLKIDGAVELATADFISVAWPFATDFETTIESGVVTISAWVNSADYSAERGIVGIGSTNTTGVNLIQYSDKMYFWYSGGTLLGSTSVLTDGATYYLVGVAESLSSIKFYINGALDRTTTTDLSSFNLTAVGSKIYIGEEGHAPGKTWQGSLDEVRISNVARSADWIATEYNNQFSPATFSSLGTEVPLSSTVRRRVLTIG